MYCTKCEWFNLCFWKQFNIPCIVQNRNESTYTSVNYLIFLVQNWNVKLSRSDFVQLVNSLPKSKLRRSHFVQGISNYSRKHKSTRSYFVQGISNSLPKYKFPFCTVQVIPNCYQKHKLNHSHFVQYI